MGRFGNLQDWNPPARAREAPSGLRQASRAAQSYESGATAGRFGNLGRYTSERGLYGNAQSWYTGANQGGTQNGWNTDFWDRAMEQQKRLADEGRLGRQFETPHATGVVTWDHVSKEDENKKFHFGDVYDNGKKVGNVFHQFDRDTANLMMADILFDRTTKEKMFAPGDPREIKANLEKEVSAKRHQNNVEIPQRESAIEFQRNVDKRAKTFEQGAGNEEIIAGGAVGGGAIGAGIGTVIAPGLGTAIGGAIGFGIGGIAAAMNQDALTQQAARAYEITKQSTDEHGLMGGGFATGVQQWSLFSGKLITPTSNLTQGIYDWKVGDVGDGRSEYYRTDKKGDVVRPKWMLAADIAATIADSAMQFSNPIGVGLYTTQMGGTIVGESAELAQTGSSFDYTRGGFDNIFKDEAGKFDLGSAAAGIGKVGIDAVQLGMVRGLAGKVDSARLAAGEKLAFGKVGSLRSLGERANQSGLAARIGGLREKAVERVGLGMSAEQKAAIAAGGSETERAGMKFVLDKEGQVVGKARASMSLLAPSEQLSALSTKVLAMRGASKAKGAYTTDDFYKMATAMATGERKIQFALVNGMGEGYEEAVQAVLEPLSHGHSVSATEIMNSAIYGFAGGVGMGAGFNVRTPNADQKMSEIAKMNYEKRAGGIDIPRNEWNRMWKSMTETEKSAHAAMAPLERSTALSALNKIEENQAIQVNAGVVAANRLADGVETAIKKDVAKATDSTHGNFVVVQVQDAGEIDDTTGEIQPWSMPTDAVGASAKQTVFNTSQHLRGVSLQLQQLKQDKERLDKMVAREPQNEDFLAQQAKNTGDIEQTDRVLKVGELLLNQLEDSLLRINRAPDETAVKAEVVVMNKLLADAFHERDTTLSPEDRRALSRAAFQLVARDPHDHAGSYQMLLPQVNTSLTLTNTDNLLQISHAVLSPLGADYDGDKVRLLNQLILDEDTFRTAKSGSHFLGAGGSVNIAAPKYERWVLEEMTDALRGQNDGLANFAAGQLTKIGRIIKQRYAALNDKGEPIIAPDVLNNALNNFYLNVHDGDKDARKHLLDELAREAGGQITEFAQGNMSNEWLWMDQVVRATMQRFQEGYAAHRPPPGPVEDVERDPVYKMSKNVRTRVQAKAAVMGATLDQLLPGDTLFRKFQDLHYNAYLSPVRSAEDRDQGQMLLVEQAAAYEALGQNITRAEIDAVNAKDEITARVLVRLQRLANSAKQMHPGLSNMEAMAVVANLAVSDLDVDDSGRVTDQVNTRRNGKPKQVSMVQMLLKQSLAVDRREKDSIYEISEELQSKHARIRQMTQPGSKEHPVNAENAFVEVFGAVTMYEILGEESLPFGAQLTVEQWVRQFMSRSETQRASTKQALQDNPAYLGRKQSKDMPWSLREMTDKSDGPQISAFRAMVDATTAAGSYRIALDAKGYTTGEFATRSDATGQVLRAAHQAGRNAIMGFLGLNPADNRVKYQAIAEMFNQHPDFGSRVMKLVPAWMANAVFEQRGDETFAANWLYEFWAEKDPVKAEMHFYREYLMSSLNARQILNKANEEEADEGAKQIEYGALKQRMQRVVWQLANQPSPVHLEKFMKTLYEATDLKEFIRYVNTTPGIRGDQAPLTAWIDDVAEFDKDKAKGGWTSDLEGSELREAIRTLERSATNLAKDLVDERASLQADTKTLKAIRRWHDHLNGSNVKIRTGDEELYKQFQAVINLAGESYMGFGPSAMIYQSIGAVRGFYPQAHTKGTNPDYVELAGSFDAMRDAYDYVTNYERLMASMTTLNLDAVAGNFSGVAKDGGRTMDDDGREVTWEKPDVGSMLSLFENAGTRPLARAVLFPQVMERDFDGVLRPKLLTGKELKPLLTGATHSELFNDQSDLALDPALRYLSMVEAQGRRYGGHYSVQRAVNDILIARTSAADHVLSTDELEQLVLKTYREVAMVLQGAASVAASRLDPATGKIMDPDNDPLALLMDQVKRSQRKVALARRLNLVSGVESEEMVDKAIKSYLQGRELQDEDEKREILARITPDMSDAQADQLRLLAERIDDNLARLRNRIETLLSDDMVSRSVAMFDYDEAEDGAEDTVAQIDQRKQLIAYVDNNLQMIESASGSMLTMRKLTEQMRDSGVKGNIQLEHSEWREISDAVIATYISSVTESAGANITVSPIPRNDDQRYYDTSFSYLLEPLMRSDGPIIQAAMDVHRRAGRGPETIMSPPEFVTLLGRTLFADFSFGQWTHDIPKLSREANARLDSAAAAAAISIAGNLPKRQATFAAALKRTFLKPADVGLTDDDVITRTSIKGFDLDRVVWDEVDMTLPGGKVVSRPLAQLNNRFARSVMMRYFDRAGDEQTIDLLATDRNVGRVWAGTRDFEGTGYQEIHLDRFDNALQSLAHDFDFDPASVDIDIEFFHPEAQPLDTEDMKTRGLSWHNSLLFEGTAFTLDADQSASLTSNLYFQNGSISPAAQAAALSASKLGMPAMKVIAGQTHAEREAMERTWRDDFAGMLAAKTKVLLDTDLGFGELDPKEFYNPVFKDMKIRHFVRGTDADGNPALWSAEEVIAWQNANPGVTFAGLNEAELWIPSDDVLRSMLGEQGNQGVQRIFDDILEIDLERVPAYKGVTQEMMDRFDGTTGITTKLEDTRAANLARQTMFRLRAKLDRAEKSRYDARLEFRNQLRESIERDRAAWSGTAQFDPAANLQNVVTMADEFIHAENLAFDWVGGGVLFVGPRQPLDLEISKMMLHELEAALQGNGGQAGWIFNMSQKSDQAKGIINAGTLREGQKGAMRVAPDDLVVVQLDSFNGNEKDMREWLTWFRDHGATIVLGSSDGSSDLRAEATAFLEDHMDYGKVAGSPHVFVENNRTTRYQNQKARTSSLLETRGISRRNRLATFLAKNLPIAENAAWINVKSVNKNSVAVQMNLVPTDAYAGFNVPVTPEQIDKVKAHLFGLNDDDAGKELLLEQANGHLKGKERKRADAEFLESWDSFISMLQDTPGAVLPTDEFGTGDLIPLVDNGGRVLLYRHGMQGPPRNTGDRSIEAMMSQMLKGSQNSENVAVFPTKTEKAATTHRGKVVAFTPRGGYGLQVELELDLSLYGDKLQLEWNGIKYLLTPMPDSIHLPEQGFMDGWSVDLIGSIDDTAGKEGVADLLNNHRNAFAYFGVDFLPDVAKFMGLSPSAARDFLKLVAKNAKPIPLLAAHDLLNSPRATRTLLETLAPLAEGVGSTPWIRNLDDPSVEAQITLAMLIYLSVPGTKVEDVLMSGGFNDVDADPDAQARLMPRLFTQVFDNAPFGSDLRREMNRRFNAQLTPRGADGSGYRITEDFAFHITTPDTTGTVVPADPFTDMGLRVEMRDGDVAAYGSMQPAHIVEVFEDGNPDPVAHLWYDKLDGEIHSISVKPEWQSKGVATNMLAYAERESTAHGWVMPQHSENLTAAGAAWASKTRTGQAAGAPRTVRTVDAIPGDKRAGETDENLWARKLADSKQSLPGGVSVYDEVKNGGRRPVMVRPGPNPGDPVTVVDGHERLAAALDLGLNSYPVVYEGDSTRPGAPKRAPVKLHSVTLGDEHSMTGMTGMTGWLQFSEVHSSGDNPIKNGMSFDETAKQSVSQHSMAVAYASIGARYPFPHDIAKARAWAQGQGLTRFKTEDARDGGAWRMLTNIDKTSGPRWRAPMPAEALRRLYAREEVTKFRQPLERSKKYGWNAVTNKEYDELADTILHGYNLKSSQRFLVDFWVRQILGEAKGPTVEGENRGWVSAKGALQAAKVIEQNMLDHYYPTASGEVPHMHVHDVQAIYRENQHLTDGWAPRKAGDDKHDTAESWNQWVRIALGQMRLSEDQFDRFYLLAVDGMMHTFQNAMDNMMDLPISHDELLNAKLLDPETNRLVASMDANTDLLAENPIILDTQRATLEEMLGGRRLTKGLVGRYPPKHEITKRRERLREWRKATAQAFPMEQSAKSFLKNGDALINHGSNTNALTRMLINLRVGTALINPALWFSMGPEQWIRGMLDRVANTITLQGTAGPTARLTARATENAKEGGVLQSLGFTHRYTPAQLEKLTGKNGLYHALGDNNDFKAMVYRDLWYLRPHAPGISKVEKWLENYAKFGSRMQDPTWGTRSDTMARRYLEAALQSIMATPTLNALSVDQVIAAMSTNPEWIKDNLPAVHMQATNAIAQLRSLKATPASLTLRGIYEPLSDNPNAAVSFLGNTLIKIPLLFSGYAANVATTILGLQGLSDMSAMFLHGRKKWGIIGRAQAKLAGMPYDPEGDDAHFDMSEVIEGIDLARSFIRGGLTHTGLFAFGMMAGGLGLSGEDDETKKRRKMAKLQGAGFVYDPRAVENDFRNADGMFFDHLPFGLDVAFQSDSDDARSMFQPSWIIKQFISPIMGMEKFFETGDPRQVMWGFQDALGSFPLINSLMWSDAVETASVMFSEADKEAAKNTNDGHINSMGFMTQAVGVYERMLFENAFVNSLYVGLDKYDRDPYKLPLRDSDGVIQRDIEGEARAQNLSTEQFIAENRDRLKREIAGGQWEGQLYIDPVNGEVKQGYLTRDGKSATLHAFTENRATLATVTSLFDNIFGGGNSDLIRYNMPIKTREFDKPKLSQAEVEAYILAAFQGAGGQKNLSADEISSLMKADFKRRGIFVDYSKVDARAEQLVRGQGPALMSETVEGREHLTSEGAMAVFRGLAKGSVHFGDASLIGLHIPYDMRSKIQDQWMAEIIQDGMDMGLDKTKATSRMKRLWYGPTSNSEVVGLGDLLWSKDISFDDTLQFNQLNTTYVMGPDGRPWATGWARPNVLGALGLQPLKGTVVADQGVTGTDDRGNTTYLGGPLGAMNTGLRSLELVDKSRFVPTDVEIGKSIEDAIAKAAAQDFTPFTPFPSTSRGFGFTPFRRFGGFGGGGFGGFGGGGGGFADFNPMRALPSARAPFGNDIPFINTSNPLIRRGDIRRERVWSERGRLKQWQ